MQRKTKRLLALGLALALLAAGALGYARWRRGPALAIEPLYQFDYGRAVTLPSGIRKSVATSGCGIVCMSMALRYLGADADQDPQSLFEDAILYGDYQGRDGMSQPALTRLAQRHGADGEWVAGEAAVLRRALAAGSPVICHMGGAFAGSGHYILLRALAPDGTARVNDPASAENTAAAFPIEQLIAQARGEAPFMILRRAAR